MTVVPIRHIKDFIYNKELCDLGILDGGKEFIEVLLFVRTF